jgi:hypothetical protein
MTIIKNKRDVLLKAAEPLVKSSFKNPSAGELEFAQEPQGVGKLDPVLLHLAAVAGRDRDRASIDGEHFQVLATEY